MPKKGVGSDALLESSHATAREVRATLHRRGSRQDEQRAGAIRGRNARGHEPVVGAKDRREERRCGVTPEQLAAELAAWTKYDLAWELDYLTGGGNATTVGQAKCGHTARGGHPICEDCIDAELLRRGVDVTKGGSQYAYERVDGHIRRKRKGGG